MRTALLDTNILIAFEDTGTVLSEQNAYIKRESQNDFVFYVHPLQIEDIGQDSNLERKRLLLSRIKQYRMLEQPPSISAMEADEYGWTNSKRNDVVDNSLLVCVTKRAVSYLITEDRGIHAKAERAGVADRVLTLEDFAGFFGNGAVNPELACVNNLPCHSVDISIPLFDSLREDYSFDSWFYKKCSEGQRKCWAVYQGDDLRAICIYNIEEGESINDQGFRPCDRVLKLCTFKVDPLIRGQKIGERLLYNAFMYAKTNNVSFVYFTARKEKQPQLISLATDFGFKEYGSKDKDSVFGKYLAPQTQEDKALDKAEYNKQFYPSFKNDSTVGKYLVPIIPMYHEKLFPDISTFKESLLGDMPDMYSSESNTIRKAYLSKSPIKRIEAGDLLLFYRSHDRRCINVIGTVYSVERLFNADEILKAVRRRTVYSLKEIESMLREANGKGLLVICFDLVDYLTNPITMTRLEEIGVKIPQSICSVSDECFKIILEEGMLTK